VSVAFVLEDMLFVCVKVDYREKASAVGRIPGTFFRREMRPGDREVVISRAIGKI
jgi:polyribonucleotide nucleotidyltransferase